ncbi:TorD/DmsD family molecular chaperone [Bacillus massiliigorillae]|uniref:TorD/DmsD family molecular chaperone n=1 Tax=Bacillus massiliigorillae TaxID=1243664 RepID=UPI0003A028F0|nr:molecular chaperone TorD family protein [Bacillus massiliigorillae]
MKAYETIQIILAGNTYAYNLFQNIFGNDPSMEQFEILTNEMTKEALDIFNMQDKQEYSIRINELEEFARRFHKDKHAVLEQVRTEYTRLFIGPGKLPAPPWESVYRTDARLLFQESTLEIRRRYLKYQFLPAEYPRVADDHLALELDFMANLSSMAEKACEDNDFKKLNRLLEEQKDFITNHLFKWIPEFSKKMQESSTSYLYPSMANLLNEFLVIQMEVLDEINDKVLIAI